MNDLLKERAQLIAERDNQEVVNENERRIASNHFNALLQLLNTRIATAKIVDTTGQPRDAVRFGAWVTLKIGNEKTLQQYQIVGVDEADISKKKISFISPLARILINKKVGEQAMLKLGNNEKIFEIRKIAYY